MAAHQGAISQEMQAQALEILKIFKEKAIEAASNRNFEFVGIATAVFRKAENGKEVLEKIDRICELATMLCPDTEF